MGKVRNTLTAIVLGGALALSSGCPNKPKESEYVTGTVLKESGTIVDRQKFIERSEGALFGNDSVRFSDPTYVIQFKADDEKVYTFQIKKYANKLDALNIAIEEGTKIRINRFHFNYNLNGNVGCIFDDEIDVLSKE